jgi:hypothetical protein
MRTQTDLKRKSRHILSRATVVAGLLVASVVLVAFYGICGGE